MTVILNPKLQQFVDEQVRTGRFASAEQAIEAGLARLMLDPPPEKLSDEEVAAIRRSREQMLRGQTVDASEVHKQILKQMQGE